MEGNRRKGRATEAGARRQGDEARQAGEGRVGDKARQGDKARSETAAETGAGSLAAGLYLLATPIGAADDITVRGLAALRSADALAAEDTRTLQKLMGLHGIALGARPLLAYHDHSGPGAAARIVAMLEAGRSVVYASEAGTPLISDPGYRLAQAALAAGAAVRALPGPSAALAALVVSGLPTDRFCFGGFPPPKTAARRRWLEDWRTAPGTLIFYESGRRLADSLADMAAAFGDRPAAIARELTKAFEETRRDGLAALAERVAAEGPPKGEIVVLIGPAEPLEASDAAIDAALETALETQSVKDAARTVANVLGTGRQRVYKRAVDLSESRRVQDDRSTDPGKPGRDDEA